MSLALLTGIWLAWPYNCLACNLFLEHALINSRTNSQTRMFKITPPAVWKECRLLWLQKQLGFINAWLPNVTVIFRMSYVTERQGLLTTLTNSIAIDDKHVSFAVLSSKSTARYHIEEHTNAEEEGDAWVDILCCFETRLLTVDTGGLSMFVNILFFSSRLCARSNKMCPLTNMSS